ncbi:dynein regulatory complex protein 8 isoform X2 [Meriones unguiculatus]|uniref:dynein regulatory complex protein 8 isoform X2 n=1 Tax=Meriones unguiculatus TaxID=10047 RepID=UPI00293E2F72|nr:dynein regulatory complex protein 8 isoform X2 [Meriones unguiculatus]
MTPLGPKNPGLGSRRNAERAAGGSGRPPRAPQGLRWASPRRRAPHQDGGREGAGSLREVGTIIRSLGCSPTEGELHDFIAEIEEEEPTGYIRFEKFLPVMTKTLLERKYRPISEDILLRAFEVLDTAKRGFLTKDELIKYMTEEGQRARFLVNLFLKRKWKKCCLLQLILNQIPLITGSM